MARKSEEVTTKRRKKPLIVEPEFEFSDSDDTEIEETESEGIESPFEPTPEDPIQTIVSKLKGEVEDIFVDLGERAYKEAGVALRYTVYKDGYRMGEFRHPCSWDFLHKKFGGGSYKVQAKSAEGKFLKQQSQMLGDIPEEPKVQEAVKTEIAQVTELVKELIDKKNDPKNDSVTLMMAMIQQQQQQTQLMMAQMQEQAKIQMAQMQQQAQNQMNMMMTILGSSKDESTNMSLKMAELQKEAAKQITEANNRIFEIILKQKPEKTGPDAMELIKLKSDAEKEGFERAKEMFEMIEEKSEMIAERKAEQLSGRDEEPEKKSTMDRVIETLAPALTTVLTQAAPRAPVTPQAQVVRRAPVPPLPASMTAQTAPPTVKPPVVAAASVKPIPPRPVGLGVTPISQMMATPVPPMQKSVEKVEVIEKKEETPVSGGRGDLRSLTSHEVAPPAEEPAYDVSEMRENLKKISQEILIAGYMAQKTPAACAGEVFMKAHNDFGLKKSDVQRMFPKSEIIEIGKENGLTGDLLKLVEDFADQIHV